MRRSCRPIQRSYSVHSSSLVGRRASRSTSPPTPCTRYASGRRRRRRRERHHAASRAASPPESAVVPGARRPVPLPRDGRAHRDGRRVRSSGAKRAPRRAGRHRSPAPVHEPRSQGRRGSRRGPVPGAEDAQSSRGQGQQPGVQVTRRLASGRVKQTEKTDALDRNIASRKADIPGTGSGTRSDSEDSTDSEQEGRDLGRAPCGAAKGRKRAASDGEGVPTVAKRLDAALDGDSNQREEVHEQDVPDVSQLQKACGQDGRQSDIAEEEEGKTVASSTGTADKH
ncbi:uncharacterized protein LOC119180261 isoform X2 [Rhipicephalus microplus]|uniref:uncharacterized protein LOC119180261 isoform X2 n=1 Tax=Rhipicephalus microplus TaxID=6941 RepID=UPI003F6B363C